MILALYVGMSELGLTGYPPRTAVISGHDQYDLNSQLPAAVYVDHTTFCKIFRPGA